MSAPERRDPQDAVFAPEELLRALPTPCYVYDEAQLRTRAARLRSAFSWSAGFRAWFPVRALPNPTVLRILREAGTMNAAICDEIPADLTPVRTYAVTGVRRSSTHPTACPTSWKR